MKYQRITGRRETPLVMSMWAGDSESLKIYNRLAELENKIESGELVDRNEYLDRLMAAKDISGMTDKEIEFFARHNERVREAQEKALKEVATVPVREILNRMFQIIGRSQDKPEYRNRLTSDMLDAIDEFADKYDVEVEE